MNTLMKTTALAATLALGTTAAYANNFGFQTLVEDNNTIELNLVTSDADGFVVIYDYAGGEFGEVLGTVEVSEGANDDLVVPLDPAANTTDIAAVLYAGPITTPMEADAWITLDVSDDS
ncbi:hypothetical protein AB3Y40_09415 [Yoonia sp. R2331]|uniref:DUF7282 domain-containing protein n=1 Tax=Yoonia sp. R2331 TaxID=3237238 RepID=UPI0034E46C5D